MTIVSKSKIAREAHDAALRVVKHEKSEDNPYPPGSDAHAAFDAEFESQLSAIKQGMGIEA